MNKPTNKNFITNIIDNDNNTNKFSGRVQTRFPPEPNGYLHIGHAKSICLNFEISKSYNGKCNLRFDDTNPEKENVEFIESIKKDIEWLGYQWDEMHFASDYFNNLYNYALKLISEGYAYIDSSSPDEIKRERGTLTEPGINSKDRDRAIEENLKIFEEMKNGKHEDGKYILRLKIDMSSPNINMRDPIIYRIKNFKHHKTGNDWCIYPMYDFTHCISDAIENVTHSLCTLEFEDHRELYDWIIKKIGHVNKPQQIEFARLALEHNLMSKRKLSQLVEEKYVSGWDDPRMPTISGMRRRGFTPNSIKDFCSRIGITKKNSSIEMGVLENTIREELNLTARRIMGVLDPLKITITNYPENDSEEIFASNNPNKDNEGKRGITISKHIFIDKNDFMEIPEKKYFRLAPGKEVRLRHAFNIVCNNIVKDNSGNIIELECTFDPVSRDMSKGNKVKGMIHWVDANNCVDATVNIYDRLFSDPNPLNLKSFNKKSLIVKKNAKIEKNVNLNNYEERYQFERVGYFIRDNKSSNKNIVYNKIVSLKDSWKKISK
ncbi:MAG: glutamine--tRNA ligase/YqeY domain fusion protein [Gammaproteobacteria bacterium]|jgi:glutaminyl-tRNA synthetase|nr:glutamine--tRNA ligase/YqeY domain fusion protein [Gammaproteobacteria bacterium]